MSAPTFQAVGTVVSSTGPLTVVWPAHEIDDVALLFVESANEAVSLTTAAGFAAVTNQGTGTAAAAGATRLSVFWCRATSAAQASPVVADSGRRQTAFIMTFRGVIKSGNPWDVFAGAVAAAASASVSMTGLTTTVTDTLVVSAFSNPLDPAATSVQPASLANSSLANLTKRKNTQADGTGGSTTSGFLPVGMQGFGSGGEYGDVGEGPDLVAADPRVRSCVFVPNISTIGAQIDAADLYDVQMILNVAGNKASYTTTVNGVPTLDMAKYTNNVRKFRPDADNTAFPDRLKLADAIKRHRVVLYVVDEPNLATSQTPNVPNITPDDCNSMALLHKSVWTGYDPLTIVRAPAITMANGWGGRPKPSGGWTGVDYCWMQYTLQDARGGPAVKGWNAPADPLDVLNTNFQIIEDQGLDMGVFASLNMWAGGIGLDSSLGVTARWNTDQAGTFGYVKGTRDTPEAGVYTSLLPDDTVKSHAANPAWIQKFAERLATDTRIPSLTYWQHVSPSSPSSEFINFYQRSDYRAAFDAAINFGLARTTFDGWRDAK